MTVPRVGVIACSCWARSKAGIDADAIVAFAGELPGVAVAEATDDLCGRGHASLAADLVRRHGLDRLVVAACACCNIDQRCPACEDERAALRDEVLALTGLPWAHHAFVNVKSHPNGVEDAKTMVAMAVARLRVAPAGVPPAARRTPVREALVVGAGAQSRVAMQELVARGVPVHIVDSASPARDPSQLPDGLRVHAPARVALIEGGAGEFDVTLERLGGVDRLRVGVILIGPGLSEEQSRSGIGWGLPHQSMAAPPRRVRGAFLIGAEGVAAAGSAEAFLDRDVTGPESAAVVDPAACIGCLKCHRVCPFDAVGREPLDFELGRFSYAGHIAAIDPLLCTGCGACASACMNLAVDLPGYTSAELEAALSAGLARTPSIGFVCNWSAYRAYDEAARAKALPEGLVLIRVPCLSRISPALVEHALERGADPLVLIGCREDGCHYRARRAVLDESLLAMQPSLLAQGDLDRVKAIWLGVADKDLLISRVSEALEEQKVAKEEAEERGAREAVPAPAAAPVSVPGPVSATDDMEGGP
jgi:coenzyme F420-reducing hydrogenase delta subunit/NAD-dependent dihydropyrimidine dehydrogenase PreA subunit